MQHWGVVHEPFAAEEEKIEATAKTRARQKSLELLFDYTKFHIALYLTLTAAYITVATAKIGNKPLLSLDPKFFWLAIGAFMIAGLGGRRNCEQHYSNRSS